MKFQNKLKIYLLIIAVFTGTNFAFAAEKYAVIEKGAKLNISDCVKIALKNSPLVKQAHYNYKISKADVGLAKSGFFPTLGVGAGYNYNANKNDRFSSNMDYYSAEASLNQLIWNFGRTNARIKMQKFNKIATLYNFDNVVLQTIYGVKNYYYAVLAAKATVEINKANVQINERNYQRTKAYFNEGIKSKIDLVNAEVNLSDSKVTLVQAEKTYQNALVKLNNAMYVAYTPEYEIESTETFNFKTREIPVNLQTISDKTDLSKAPDAVADATLITGVEKLDVIENYKFKPFPYTFEECVKEADKNRPDLKAYSATIEAMKQSLLYIKREYYPSITGSVGYGYRDTSNTNSLNIGIGIKSSVNIMGKKYEIDSGKLQIDLAENTLEMAKQNMYFDIQNAYVNMIQYEKEIPLLAVKVKQTRENFELADGRYAVGLGDYIQLQDAKVNYNNAQHSYVQAVYNYNVSRSDLEKLIALPQEITVTVEDKKK